MDRNPRALPREDGPAERRGLSFVVCRGCGRPLARLAPGSEVEIRCRDCKHKQLYRA
jgi:LSD1 subclass zinc finger protein